MFAVFITILIIIVIASSCSEIVMRVRLSRLEPPRGKTTVVEMRR